MAICERCGKEHDGSYGSGRFCSERCANFRGNIHSHPQMKLMEYKCIYCGKVWITNKSGYTYHVNRCKQNPHALPPNTLTEETKQKISNTLKQNHYHHNQETRQKLSKIAKQRQIGGYIKGSGRGKKGWYKGIWCDSSWELAFVIWSIDNNYQIERNNKRFPYEYEGKSHDYIPDFLWEGKLVEIKGYETEQWTIKYNTYKDIITVFTKIEMKPIIDYVEHVYGKDFIRLYEN